MRSRLRPARTARIRLLEMIVQYELDAGKRERTREKLNRLKAEELIGLPDERTYGETNHETQGNGE